MSGKHVVILKNDAVGDLVHSLHAINNIVYSSDVDKITIFVSKLSYKFDFLFAATKIKVKVLNYNLSLVDRIKLFFFILSNKIEKIYILTPKNYYYYLPVFFYKTKFYAICVNNINNYKRPSEFLRKFLYKYVINDRSVQFKRISTSKLQVELTNNVNSKKNQKKINADISEKLKRYLPNNYTYFHVKRKILNELGWGIKELKILFNEFLKYSDHVVITKDVGLDDNTLIFKENFTSLDFNSSKFIDNKKKIIFFDNIDGKDLYNTILHSKKVVAFHGMMTNIASINRQKVLDLFHCNIKDWNDYRNYRNSFYEFKPNYDGYNFIIPNKDINKTIKKIRRFL